MKKITIVVSIILSLSILWGTINSCQVDTTPPILEFGELASGNETAKWENELGRWKPTTAFVDGEEKALTSLYFEDLYVDEDINGEVALIFDFNEEGSRLYEQITERLIGHSIAFFWDNEVIRESGDYGLPLTPIIMAVISDSGLILGLSLDEAIEIYEQWKKNPSPE